MFPESVMNLKEYVIFCDVHLWINELKQSNDLSLSVMNSGTIYNCKLTIKIKLAHIHEHGIKFISLKILYITCSF